MQLQFVTLDKFLLKTEIYSSFVSIPCDNSNSCIFILSAETLSVETETIKTLRCQTVYFVLHCLGFFLTGRSIDKRPEGKTVII